MTARPAAPASPRPPVARLALLGLGVVVVVTLTLKTWDALPDDPRVSDGARVGAVALQVIGSVGHLLAALACGFRWPVFGRRWRRRLALHLGVGVTAALWYALADDAAYRLIPQAGVRFTALGLVPHLVGYAVSAGIAMTVRLAGRLARWTEARRRLARAVAGAGRRQAEAELRALKAALHPVVVARALADAAERVRTDPRGAERIAVQLGVLMREAVAAADTQETTLGEELERLGYDVEQADEWTDGDTHVADDPSDEDGDRALRVRVAADAQDAVVPHLLVPALLACLGDARPHTLRAHRAPPPGAPPGVDGEDLPLVLTVHGHGDTADGVAGGTAARIALARRLDRAYGPGAWSLDVRSGRTPRVTLVVPAEPEVTDALPTGGAPPVPPAPPTGPLAGTGRAWRALEGWAVAATSVRAVSPGDGGTGRNGGPDDGGATGSRLLPLAIGFGALWLIMGVVGLALHATTVRRVATPVAYVSLVVSSLLATWATFRRPLSGTPAEVARARRFHGAVANVAGVAGMLLMVVMSAASASGGTLVARAIRIGLRDALFYTMAVGVLHGVLFVVEQRRAQRLVRELRAALTDRAHRRGKSELRALKAELNPHFVGNALHTAAALATRDPQAAARMFGALGALADEAAARVDVQEVPLHEEIAGLAPFLALERERLRLAGGDLAVTWEIPDALLDAAAPHLVLQPLAENAVRHGLAPRGGGRLVIRAERADGRLRLIVADDGVGLAAAAERPARNGVGAGAGVGGVQRRLALLHGAAASCRLTPGPLGGTVATVEVPFRRSTSNGELVTMQLAAGG